MKFSVPTIPNDWSWAVSGEVIDVRDGTHDTPSYIDAGIPLITSKNLKSHGLDFTDVSYISEADHVAIGKRSAVDMDDILFAMIGTIGNPVIVNDDRDFSIKNVALFKCSGGPVYPKYFHRVLSSSLVKMQLDEATRGGTQKFVSLKVLRNLQFPLPPLAEQKRIAAILDAADKLRAKRREAIAQLDTLLQSTFLDMFGDPVTNSMGWDSKTLGEIIKFTGGSQPPKDTFVYEPKPDYVRLVQIRDFKTDKYKTYIPESLARRVFSKDDVMIARYGPPVFQILSGLSGSYNVALMKAEPIDKKIEKLFIYYLLSSDSVNKAVVGQSERTAGQTGVNLSFLNDYPAYSPPLNVQKKFVKVVESVRGQKKLQEKHHTDSDTLFLSLQQRAFNGTL